MTDALHENRRRALKEAIVALLILAPVAAYLLAVDYGRWRLPAPNDAFTVALLTPAFLGLIRAAYTLISGRRGSYPFGPLAQPGSISLRAIMKPSFSARWEAERKAAVATVPEPPAGH